MDNTPPGLPVLHLPPESTQAHTNCPSDPIQLPHPLPSPPSFAFGSSQHQAFLQGVLPSHQGLAGVSSSTTIEGLNPLALSLPHGPTLTAIHCGWENPTGSITRPTICMPQKSRNRVRWDLEGHFFIIFVCHLSPLVELRVAPSSSQGPRFSLPQVLEDIFQNLEPSNSTMSIEDFFYGLFKIGKPLPPSASTPYRQLKRHLSMQAFDESGRRTTTPSAMTSTIGFRVFSSLDDGLGYAEVEQILDAWHEEGIENSHEILKDLDFSLDGKINLADLTLALENELLVAKNRIYQAALASFKAEIRHLMERVDQVVREKEKLRLDLEKAEKLTSRMASEVDDHHAAIERQNEYNLSKLDEDYKERVAALRNELRKDREQLQLQAGKQRAELEQEMEKLRTEENYLRDRLALTLKENSRLEKELLETGEKLVKYESTVSKLQKYWENVLAEKFGDLDPGSAEFFLQEERLMQMKNKHEAQCRNRLLRIATR
ncbi:Ninein [Varanus komodoensis]|nr:Ninein [Varanus komodoensis]